MCKASIFSTGSLLKFNRVGHSSYSLSSLALAAAKEEPRECQVSVGGVSSRAIICVKDCDRFCHDFSVRPCVRILISVSTQHNVIKLLFYYDNLYLVHSSDNIVE